MGYCRYDDGRSIDTVDRYDVVIPLYGALQAEDLRLAAGHFLAPPTHDVDCELEGVRVFPTLPAPGALILVAIGLLGIGWMRRRRMILHDAE
jgi:hypothetical protein